MLYFSLIFYLIGLFPIYIFQMRFWAELFAGLGEEIPQDIPGTNPNDMARDPQLKEVARCY